MKPRKNPTYRIYSIRDTSGNVRYVGITRNPLLDRLWTHSLAKTPVGCWIRGEIEAKRKVVIKLECVFRGNSKAAHAKEKETIAAYYRVFGDLMFNSHGIPNLKTEFLCEEQ